MKLVEFLHYIMFSSASWLHSDNMMSRPSGLNGRLWSQQSLPYSWICHSSKLYSSVFEAKTCRLPVVYFCCSTSGLWAGWGSLWKHITHRAEVFVVNYKDGVGSSFAWPQVRSPEGLLSAYHSCVLPLDLLEMQLGIKLTMRKDRLVTGLLG